MIFLITSAKTVIAFSDFYSEKSENSAHQGLQKFRSAALHSIFALRILGLSGLPIIRYLPEKAFMGRTICKIIYPTGIFK